MPTQSKHPGKLAYWEKGDLWIASYVMPGMENFEQGFMIACIRKHVIDGDPTCKAEFNKLCKRALRLFLARAIEHAEKVMRAA